MTAIDKLQQWRLLVGVCPLFESNLAWTPHTRRPVDGLVVDENAALLKGQLRDLRNIVPAIVPAKQVLADDKAHEFISKINSLLSTLETLLQDAIKETLPHQTSPADEVSRIPSPHQTVATKRAPSAQGLTVPSGRRRTLPRRHHRQIPQAGGALLEGSELQ